MQRSGNRIGGTLFSVSIPPSPRLTQPRCGLHTTPMWEQKPCGRPVPPGRKRMEEETRTAAPAEIRQIGRLCSASIPALPHPQASDLAGEPIQDLPKTIGVGVGIGIGRLRMDTECSGATDPRTARCWRDIPPMKRNESIPIPTPSRMRKPMRRQFRGACTPFFVGAQGRTFSVSTPLGSAGGARLPHGLALVVR